MKRYRKHISASDKHNPLYSLRSGHDRPDPILYSHPVYHGLLHLDGGGRCWSGCKIDGTSGYGSTTGWADPGRINHDTADIVLLVPVLGLLMHPKNPTAFLISSSTVAPHSDRLRRRRRRRPAFSYPQVPRHRRSKRGTSRRSYVLA